MKSDKGHVFGRNPKFKIHLILKEKRFFFTS